MAYTVEKMGGAYIVISPSGQVIYTVYKYTNARRLMSRLNKKYLKYGGLKNAR